MELQAVILAAGLGSRLTDLTEEMPKALLPIANKPMIWYPIQLLERAHFKEALVVTRASSRDEIREALKVKYPVNLQLEYVTIPDEEEDDGTADTLRRIKDKIKHDLLLISCDLITDVSLHLVIDVHRTYDSTLTMLLAPLPEETLTSLPGDKCNRNTEKDLIGFDETGKRILFMASEADFEESITFKKTLLERHPFIDIHSNLLDAHLYVIKKWVVDYLEEKTSISAVKGELVPHLVDKQFSSHKATNGEENTKCIIDYVQDDGYTKLAQEYSSWNDHSGDLEDCYHGDKIHCHAYVMTDGFCLRTNTLWAYCEANRQVPRKLSSLSASKDAQLVKIGTNLPKTSTVAPECVVGEDSQIGDKISIKKSVIGSHCKIADKVKITNSIIMDHVMLAEGVSVNGCIIFPKAQIGAKSELKDCIVGTNQCIDPESTYINEILVDGNRMIPIG